jgi:DNA repair exonuclease SbcCD ATPase subunit
MKLVRFLSLVLENFRSYQALSVSLDQDSTVMVVGKNGAGKSNIFVALVWVLFGKALHGFHIKDMVRRGTARCSVSLSFISAVGEMIDVMRTRTEKTEHVYVTEGKVRTRYGSAEGNRVIAGHLGINLKTFVNTVFVGGGINRFFLMMRDGDKKALLEDLFDLDRFGVGYKGATKRLNALDLRLEEHRTESRMMQHALDQLKNEESALGRKNLTRFMAKMKGTKDALEALLPEIEKLEEGEETREADIYAVRQRLSEANGHLRKAEGALSFEHSRIHTLTAMEGDDCPECERPLTKRDCAHLLKSHEDQVEKLTRLVEDGKEALIPIEEELDRLVRLKDLLEEARDRKEDLLEDIKDLEIERDRVRADYSEVVSKQRKHFRGKKMKADHVCRKISETREYFEFWVNGFGSKGVKNEFLGQVLPTMEACSNDYLAKLSEHFTIELSLEEGSFSTLVYSTALGEMEYRSCSTGERRRLDLAVSLALRDIIEEIAGVQTNLQVFDEVVEGLDREGSEQFSDVVRNLPVPKSAFILSHNEALMGCLDTSWLVQNTEGCSQVLEGA